LSGDRSAEELVAVFVRGRKNELNIAVDGDGGDVVRLLDGEGALLDGERNTNGGEGAGLVGGEREKEREG
jgi:hypothetical protein